MGKHSEKYLVNNSGAEAYLATWEAGDQ